MNNAIEFSFAKSTKKFALIFDRKMPGITFLVPGRVGKKFIDILIAKDRNPKQILEPMGVVVEYVGSPESFLENCDDMNYWQVVAGFEAN
jgi:hypothetical protein